MPSAAVPKMRLAVFWSQAARQRFTLQLELQAPVAAEAVDELRKRILAFANLGSRGAFVDPLLDPTSGRLQLMAEHLDQAKTPGFELEAEHFDVRGLRVLVNIIESYSVKVHAVSKVEIRSHPPAPAAQMMMPAITEDSAHELYPEISGSAIVNVDLDEPQDYHKSRRCLVEFPTRASRDKLEALMQRMGEWAAVVEYGGYSLPVRPPHEAEAWVDTLQIFDDYSVELVFSLFEAADEAWASLLNLLSRFSSEVDRIALVSID